MVHAWGGWDKAAAIPCKYIPAKAVVRPNLNADFWPVFQRTAGKMKIYRVRERVGVEITL
jgi:hypothetical protein